MSRNRGDGAATSAEKTHSAFQLRPSLIRCTAAVSQSSHSARGETVQAIAALRLFPELFKRTRTQFAVMGRVLDVHVTKPQLQPPRIVARIREQMPARVPQHGK